MNRPFLLSVAVDFPDDLSNTAFDRAMFRQMMRIFKSWGVRRIYWLDYGSRNDGMYEMSARAELRENVRRTFEAVGDILTTAVQSAHQEGLEIFAVIKPFELGMPVSHSLPPANWVLNPLGGLDIGCATFIREHPDLRMKARFTDDLNSLRTKKTTKLEIFSQDEIPRLGPGDTVLWTSRDNREYQRYQGDVKVRAAAGVARLDNLDIRSPFLAITFSDRNNRIYFRNRVHRLIRVCGEDGTALPATIGLALCGGESPRNSGIIFNWVPGVPTGARKNTFPDESVVLGREQVFLGIALGRDPYVAGAPCPVCPEVQDFWLRRVRRCVQKGVDGIDFRIDNHNSPFDWGEYGFNQPVVDEYRKRYGVDIITEDFDRERWRTLRGEYYTGFLKRSRALLTRAGKKMQVHIDWKKKRVPGIPPQMEIAWQWEKWIEDGLCDGITLKSFGPGMWVSVKEEIVRKAKAKSLPVYYCPWFSDMKVQPDKFSVFAEQLRKAREEKDIDGFIIYEAEALLREGRKEGVRSNRDNMASVLTGKDVV